MAEAVTFEVAALFWASRNEGRQIQRDLRAAPTAISPLHEQTDMNELLSQYVRLADTCPMPVVAYELGQLFTSLLPKSIKAVEGMFFTPPSLAQKLLHMATEAGTDWHTARILETACGSGAFLQFLLEELICRSGVWEGKTKFRMLKERLVAYEKDPCLAWLAKVLVDAVMLPLAENQHEGCFSQAACV